MVFYKRLMNINERGPDGLDIALSLEIGNGLGQVP